MRSAPTYWRLNRVRFRLNYIADLDGAHKAKGLVVRTVWVGAADAIQFFALAKKLMSRRGQVGAHRKHAAWEVTLHPADEIGPDCAFADQAEMLRAAYELIRQMHCSVALIGLHGLRDLHILMLNVGPTGMALKSYLPHRSNPKRVLAAAADRIERELNAARRESGKRKLLAMHEVRTERRKAGGRDPLPQLLAKTMLLDKQPDVAALLEAFRSIGCGVKLKGNRLQVVYDRNRGPKTYQLDLLKRGVLRAWWQRRREEEKATERLIEEEAAKLAKERRHSANRLISEQALVDFEVLTRAVHQWVETGSYDSVLHQWLFVDGAGFLSLTPAAEQIVTKSPTAEAKELLGALAQAWELRNEFLKQREQEADKDRE